MSGVDILSNMGVNASWKVFFLCLINFLSIRNPPWFLSKPSILSRNPRGTSVNLFNSMSSVNDPLLLWGSILSNLFFCCFIHFDNPADDPWFELLDLNPLLSTPGLKVSLPLKSPGTFLFVFLAFICFLDSAKNERRRMIFIASAAGALSVWIPWSLLEACFKLFFFSFLFCLGGCTDLTPFNGVKGFVLVVGTGGVPPILPTCLFVTGSNMLFFHSFGICPAFPWLIPGVLVGPFGPNPWPLFWLFGPNPGPLVGPFGPNPNGPFGKPLGPNPGPILGPLGINPGPFWGPFGPNPGPFWGPLGPNPGPFRGPLGPNPCPNEFKFCPFGTFPGPINGWGPFPLKGKPGPNDGPLGLNCCWLFGPDCCWLLDPNCCWLLDPNCCWLFDPNCCWLFWFCCCCWDHQKFIAARKL